MTSHSCDSPTCSSFPNLCHPNAQQDKLTTFRQLVEDRRWLCCLHLARVPALWMEIMEIPGFDISKYQGKQRGGEPNNYPELIKELPGEIVMAKYKGKIKSSSEVKTTTSWGKWEGTGEGGLSLLGCLGLRFCQGIMFL